jgi:hypothetical protein
MKPAFLLRGVLAMGLVAFGAVMSAHAQNGKMEIVGGDTHDWGTVPPSTLSAVIEVKNIGTGDLNITDVHPGCGCTLTHGIDKKTLKPGEIGKFDVSINVATYPSGPITKVVTIKTSDSTDANHMLRLTANIKRAITISPAAYLTVTEGKVGSESTSSSIHIKNTGDKAFTIFPPDSTRGNAKLRFDMKQKKELKPGEELELKAYVTPNEKSFVQGGFKMKTTSEESPWLDMNVTGTMAREPQQNAQTAPAPTHSSK